MIEIMSSKPCESRTAFCFSTKDRLDLTNQTLPRVLEEEGDFDVYLVDGSTEFDSKLFLIGVANSVTKVKGLHENVVGGADVAILYNLSLLLEKGYDYIGLIENDVLLETGWFKAMFDLFEKGRSEGLKVGSVSARTYTTRIQVGRGDYALMKNIGAGMVLFTREAVQAILNNFHTGTFGEPSFLFGHYTGLGGVVPWQLNRPDRQEPNRILTCADWFFEPSMLPYGLATLALTPSMAKNIDEAVQDPLQKTTCPIDTNIDWKKVVLEYEVNQKRPDSESIDPVQAIMPHYDPVLKEWRGYCHQLACALPNAFKGKWGLKWNMYHGPFTLVTKEPGCKLAFPYTGIYLRIIIGTGDKPAKLKFTGDCGDGELNFSASKDMQCLNLSTQHSGPFEIEFTFDRPGIEVVMFNFEGPQPWFKSKYGLRYKHLEPYLVNNE